MSKKYKFSLYIIAIILGTILLILGGYYIYKYNKDKNSAEVEVFETLSFNYLNGKNIEFRKKEKEIKFSVINDGEESSTYNISLNRIKFEGKKVYYTLYENNKKIVDKTKLENNSSKAISTFVNIDGNKTKSYKLVLDNPDKDKVSFEIVLEKSDQSASVFSQAILANNKIEKDPKTKVGEEVSVTDEGLIADVDDNGNTYYFRGDTSKNYVTFADKTWRIVRINGNGTVKLVLNNDINSASMYKEGTTDRLSNTKKITNLEMYSSLKDWYNNNLKDYDEYIYNYNFCMDTTKEGDNLANYLRINLANTPTFNCLGTKNSLKIGLLTVDEIIYAGAKVNEQNNHYYLYNSESASSSWTLSPAKDAVEGLYYYELTQTGSVTYNSTGESTKNLRPVINIKKDIEVEGEGTKENPYTLK